MCSSVFRVFLVEYMGTVGLYWIDIKFFPSIKLQELCLSYGESDVIDRVVNG